MRQFYPHFIANLSVTVEQIAALWRGEESSMITPINEVSKQNGIKVMTGVYEECISLELRASAKTAQKMLRLFKKDDACYQQQTELLDELKCRIIDELEGHFFLSLTPSEAHQYENWTEHWEEILARFGEASRDIEEMHKCFALGRYTASMFHALHVAEWGAIKLGDFIGVVDHQKAWGPTERRLQELINKGYKELPESLNGKFQFLEQMHREIDSMVHAWRHKVDHAANHLSILPNTDFTPDIAEHIIGSVRIFMIRLIEGIPIAV